MTTERRSWLKQALIWLMRVAAVGLIGLSACSQKPAKFNAMDVTDAPWGQSYSLPDLQGKITTQASFSGKVTAVFFGFMYCPDACPTHLTKMGEVKKLLGKHAEKFQIVFITIDPERDAANQLKKYLASFDPTIVGLRGSLDQTQAIAKDFRVFYKKVDTKDSRRDPKAYTIDHTTFTYVYDGQGKLRLVIPHDLAVEKIASDIRNLITR